MRGPEFLTKQSATGLKVLDGTQIGIDEPNMDDYTLADCRGDKKANYQPCNPKGTKVANYL